MTEVILPNNSPVRSARGHVMPNRALATSSACLEALKLLYKVQWTVCHLMIVLDGLVGMECDGAICCPKSLTSRAIAALKVRRLQVCIRTCLGNPD